LPWLRPQRRRAFPGVSLPELLAVVALLALALLVTIPLVSSRVHEARLRAAASQFVTTLRAARMIAISKNVTCTVTVAPDPANRYAYTDASGALRTVELPAGVRFDPATPSFAFRPDGRLDARSEAVIEAALSGGRTEIWRVIVPPSGIAEVKRESR
jgi:Tfp pilus assembly protein FimT